MKFASVLRNSAEELPDLADLFALYKQLKKSLKRIPNREDGTDHSQASQDTLPSNLPDAQQEQQQQQQPDEGAGPPPAQAQPLVQQPAGLEQALPASAAAQLEQQPQEQQGFLAGAAAEEPARAPAEAADAAGAAAGVAPAPGIEQQLQGTTAGVEQAQQAQQQQQQQAVLDEQEEAFMRTITEDVQKLNDSYIEKEELNVIKLGTLEEKAGQAASAAEVQEAYKEFVDFHGELLLLLHWSILAYTGLVKILKKHHKRTGLLLRAPHLENLLSQPFCSVEVTCDMVRRAEDQVNALAARLQVPPPDKVAAAAGAAAAAAAGMHGPAETVNSPFYHVGSGNNLRAMAEAAAAAAVASAGRADPAGPLPPCGAGGAAAGGGQGSGAGSGAGSGTGGPAPAAAAAASAAMPPPAPAAAAGMAAPAAGSAPAAGGASTGAGSVAGRKRGAEELEVAQGSDMMRRTRAALNVWQQLQVTASTPSTVLPAGQTVQHPAQAAASGMTNSSVA